MLKRDMHTAAKRKCKKLTGDENAYTEAHNAKEQAKQCIKSWVQTEGLETDLEVAHQNRNIKPLVKK